MDETVARHILMSRTTEGLKDIGALAPKLADASERPHIVRGLERDLKAGLEALGLKISSPNALALAKERLLTAMEAVGSLTGSGDSLVRGGDFNGLVDEGKLSSSALRDILAPERPAAVGTRYAMASNGEGGLRVSEAAGPMHKGKHTATLSQVASAAVNKVARSADGFDAVWEAVAVCARAESSHAELANGSSWSKATISEKVEDALAARLERLPVAPGTEGFPAAPAQNDMRSKLAARRESAVVPTPFKGMPATKQNGLRA